MRKAILTLLGVAALTVGAFAADLSGKWTAEMKGRNGETRQTVFTLKADGDKLSGTMSGVQGGEWPIVEGKVDGENVSFVVKREFNGDTRLMNYTGKLQGDELHLKVETPQGAREFTAKRSNPS